MRSSAPNDPQGLVSGPLAAPIRESDFPTLQLEKPCVFIVQLTIHRGRGGGKTGYGDGPEEGANTKETNGAGGARARVSSVSGRALGKRRGGERRRAGGGGEEGEEEREEEEQEEEEQEEDDRREEDEKEAEEERREVGRRGEREEEEEEGRG